jgi:ABC-type spermidine/putrescine transport system permease subunit II
MISRRQKIVLWSCFALLVFLSAVGVWFSFGMRQIIPMVLNDSSLDFGQLPDYDRLSAYHQAQTVMMPVALVMLALTICWGVLAGFSIWRLSRKSEGGHPN